MTLMRVSFLGTDYAFVQFESEKVRRHLTLGRKITWTCFSGCSGCVGNISTPAVSGQKWVALTKLKHLPSYVTNHWIRYRRRICPPVTQGYAIGNKWYHRFTVKNSLKVGHSIFIFSMCSVPTCTNLISA